jgi:Tudor domain
MKTVPQLQSKTQVKIMFWNSPHEFFIQTEDGFKDYENLMRHIQTVYNKSPPKKDNQPAIGDYVVAKNRKDNFWYRAKITAYNPLLKKYKLEFVDVGNCQITDEGDIHPIEGEFTKLPAKAIKLSLENIISCGDNETLTSNLNRYINPQNSIICEILRSENNRFFATVQIDDKDLKTSLINDNFVMDLPASRYLTVCN